MGLTFDLAFSVIKDQMGDDDEYKSKNRTENYPENGKKES